MKKRITILILLTALLVSLVWWFWPRSETRTVADAKVVISAPVAPSAVPSAAPANKAANPTGTSTARPELKTQLQEVMTSANQPISFFGKVIDQDGDPIPGAKVTLKIRYMKTVGSVGIGDTFAEPSLTTGTDGQFALTDAKGSLLVLKALTKEGYEPSPKAFNGTYWYWRDKNPYRPDPSHPEIFRMWKKMGAEPLVRKGFGKPLLADGTPAEFDLLDGRVVAQGGDLRVKLERVPQKVEWGQRNYEWTITVEAIDGGIVESREEQMYRAPADGYQPKLLIHMAANDANWSDTKDVAAYIKIRGGKLYGRVEMKFMVGSDREAGTPFNMTSFINPSGSQNLEYDPRQPAVQR
jgi:hypothetical protein